MGANCGSAEKRGVFYFNGRNEKAPRVALVLSGVVEYDELAWALHSCDNANCVNPKHLRWGTRKENHEDKMYRGRNSNGVPTPREKTAVHRLLTDGVEPDIVARAFGFSTQQIMEF